MECVEARTALHAYLDRELDAVNGGMLERHLEACAQCRQSYEQQRRLKAAIREKGDYYEAPSAFVQRMRAMTVRPEGSRQSARNWRWQWLHLGAAMAMTAIVTWMVTLQFVQPSTADLTTEEVIAGHARAMINGRLADVASSDQHTVKPWLSARLDFSPPVMDLVTSGFPLVGGRLDYVDHRPVAVLVYHRRQHVIDLFVWPEPDARATPPTSMPAKQGYHILRWNRGGMSFWAISDVSPDDLSAFARLYASAN